MTTPQGTRVLVADDDPDIRDLVDFKLSQAGYTVQAVPDGLAAWEAFQEEAPALVILDVMMPGLSGIDVLRKIRDSETPTTPVLLLSAKSRDTDVDTGFAVGADDYVIKPFSPRELLHRVNGILSRAR
ncbi:response regulator transcription factor [Phycicoccus sp. M110.8]|uniref:response regulator transcription factor n=1 Tax=Phycicoccus sp. M110.8 TaxID=3075433 RepID=UPI0028FD3586|nr:response regulator transcription factor [Phycicoccus sp. M110.8]MDU0314693.1 response regulator transcription factor [Phycicoccus sp. M110.8]